MIIITACSPNVWRNKRTHCDMKTAFLALCGMSMLFLYHKRALSSTSDNRWNLCKEGKCCHQSC